MSDPNAAILAALIARTTTEAPDFKYVGRYGGDFRRVLDSSPMPLPACWWTWTGDRKESRDAQGWVMRSTFAALVAVETMAGEGAALTAAMTAVSDVRNAVCGQDLSLPINKFEPEETQLVLLDDSRAAYLVDVTTIYGTTGF